MSSNIQPIKYSAGFSGGYSNENEYVFPEGSGQTFKAGAPLKFSSGTVVIISSVSAPTIAGIASNAATGTAGTASAPNCWVALPANSVFEVSVDTTTTSGTAALGTGKPSDFSIGGTYELLLDSTSGNYYMGTGTGNPTFTLLGYDPSQNSVVNGRVYVRILASQTAWT